MKLWSKELLDRSMAAMLAAIEIYSKAGLYCLTQSLKVADSKKGANH